MPDRVRIATRTPGPSARSRWKTVTAASLYLGISKYKVNDLVRRGLLECLYLPASRPLISADDLERLFAESHRPARPEPSAAE
jgi:hypothetical protein